MTAAVPAAAHGASGDSTPYYLALGDSLSQGVQPNSTNPGQVTNHGYVDDLYALYRHRVRGLHLKKLGCPGETTSSFLTGTGSPCAAFYGSGWQLMDAEAFLSTHHVVLLTIDLGANDITASEVSSCIGGDCAALSAAGAIAVANLGQILYGLEGAANGARIVGMNYYDPYVVVSEATVPLVVGLNGALDHVYGLFGVPVANVQDAFQTQNTTVIPFINQPVNVVVVCALTWMCAPAPFGPNTHANNVGYGVIAATFARTIGRL